MREIRAVVYVSAGQLRDAKTGGAWLRGFMLEMAQLRLDMCLAWPRPHSAQWRRNVRRERRALGYMGKRRRREVLRGK